MEARFDGYLLTRTERLLGDCWPRFEASVKAAEKPRRRSEAPGEGDMTEYRKAGGDGVPQARRQTGEPVRQRLRQSHAAAAPVPLARGD
jgi:hypothetical protein